MREPSDRAHVGLTHLMAARAKYADHQNRRRNEPITHPPWNGTSALVTSEARDHLSEATLYCRISRTRGRVLVSCGVLPEKELFAS